MKRMIVAASLFLASLPVLSQTKMYITKTNGVDSVWLSDVKNITFKTYSTVPTDTGSGDLIAYYPFDGNSNDLSGHGKHGTPAGRFSYVDGKRGQGIRLVGDSATFHTTGGYVGIPQIDTAGLRELTISVWVNEDAASGGDGYVYLSSDCDQGWCGIGHFSSSIQYAVGGNTTNKLPLTNQFDLSAVGQWTLYTLVYANNSIKAYVNGEPAGELAQMLYIYGSNATIGAHRWGGYWPGYSTHFTGVIDDVRIYRRALTALEIQSLYRLEL